MSPLSPLAQQIHELNKNLDSVNSSLDYSKISRKHKGHSYLAVNLSEQTSSKETEKGKMSKMTDIAQLISTLSNNSREVNEVTKDELETLQANFKEFVKHWTKSNSASGLWGSVKNLFVSMGRYLSGADEKIAKAEQDLQEIITLKTKERKKEKEKQKIAEFLKKQGQIKVKPYPYIKEEQRLAESQKKGPIDLESQLKALNPSREEAIKIVESELISWEKRNDNTIDHLYRAILEVEKTEEALIKALQACNLERREELYELIQTLKEKVSPLTEGQINPEGQIKLALTYGQHRGVTGKDILELGWFENELRLLELDEQMARMHLKQCLKVRKGWTNVFNKCETNIKDYQKLLEYAKSKSEQIKPDEKTHEDTSEWGLFRLEKE